ncbi:cytochrome b N-terminal domain-containing protein [Rubrolithibacter danxiaensis]|uniref:cytochrome b N-terminal domain-containing protein n=1 Tax=Rubrolithibacter danxiaensis TaxID=3390805 RepID=UPI003BF8B0A8
MKKLKKIGRWIDDRSGISETLIPLLKHPVPPGSKWAYVFGSATLFCFLLQVVTGIGLSLLYQPSSENAYQSLQFITHQAPLGRILRGIHFFGASGMIILVGIHMIRVYIMASYKYPREMSWISGVFLLFFTIGMGFTGQLLRWDSNGVWSSIVAAQQLGRIPLIGRYLAHILLGGETLGGQTLSRFFSYHVFIIPALIFLFTGFHLYLVFRNGISEPPKAGRPVDPATYRKWYKELLQKEGKPFWPYAAWRDVLFGSLVILSIIGLAIIFGAPELTEAPDPSIVYASPSPDWYMLSIFALFALMPPQIESYVIFIGPVFSILALLSLPFVSNKGERSPIRRPWAIFGVVCVMVFLLSLLEVGIKAPWSPDFNTKPLTVSAQASAPVKKGMALFYKKGCQYCHKINGEGGSTGPDLSIIGRTWNRQQLQIQIVNGSDNMPAYGGMLNKNELSALVQFLQSRK